MKNIFEGDSYYAIFAQITYKKFLSRRWITFADIMADCLGLSSANDLTCNVSNCDNYGELKKAFRDVRKLINDKTGKESFEEERMGRSKKFRYIGSDNDPLLDMRNAKVIDNLKQYWQFCQNSAGFFPTSWLDYFFKDSRDLLDIKKKRDKGEQVLNASLDRMLTNIELLPLLYEAIIRKQVLSIEYKPYEGEMSSFIFHPHYLKEFNGRWYLFGHAEEHQPEYGYNIALDRIVSNPRELYDFPYVTPPNGFYDNFFKNIIGVSHFPDRKVQDILIRAHSLYVYKLIETKVLHSSQKTIRPFANYEDGTYGEFSIQVEVNNEFIGRILQMGEGLEIISPIEVRELFISKIQKLCHLYNTEQKMNGSNQTGTN